FIVDYLDRNVSLIKELLKEGVSPKVQKKKEILGGMKIIFTGKLEEFTRKEARDAVKRLGGRTVSSVSSNTDIVVAGKNPGSKLDRAGENNVKIISEEEFIKLIEENS
ncbi:MAG: BRCT domain-containing protein, partial [Elusimicrobiota bacterium]|nr:BRCT domain-containing protein [Elusimicrobiota bacterium]